MVVRHRIRLARLRSLLALVIVTGWLTGCVGSRAIQDKSYYLCRSDQADAAVAHLDASSLAKSNKNRLLYLMERGTLLHLQGAYEESNVDFEMADRLTEELYTKSLSAGALSFLVNDGVIPYAGSDYESVYLNYYKALNYLALGELEEAGVEARQVDEKLRYFSDLYEGKTVFREDGFLRMLTGLIYQAQGDDNNAFIAYRLAWNSFQANREIYGVPIPDILWSLLVTTADRSSLWQERNEFRNLAKERGIELQQLETFAVVLVNNGRIPVKQERKALFPSGQGFPIKLALPEFVAYGGGVNYVTLNSDDQQYRSVVVENLESIAFKSLNDEIARVLVKAIARAVTKETIARKLDKDSNAPIGMLLRIVNMITENADLRSWNGLPREIQLVVAPVALGTEQVDIEIDGRSQELTLVVPVAPVGFGFIRTF